MLKDIRKGAGLSQYQLAVKSGVNVGTIRYWEQKGVGNAKVTNLKRVADALGCKVDDLI